MKIRALKLRILLAWLIMVTCGTSFGALAKSKEVDASSKRLSGKVQLSRISPPEAGVKLLEDILQRVRNSPQLAMAKQGRLRNEELAQNAQNAQKSSTDYRLTIKPKDGFKATGSTSLASLSSDEQRPNKMGIWERDRANLAMQAETDSKDQFYGTMAESSPKMASTAGTSSVWERANDVTDRLSPQSQQKLKSAAGKLFDISNKIGNATAISSLPPASTPAAHASRLAAKESIQAPNSIAKSWGSKKLASTAPSGAGIAGARSAVRGDFYRSPRQIAILDQLPVIVTSPQNKSGGTYGVAGSLRPQAPVSQNATQPVPVTAGSPQVAHLPPTMTDSLKGAGNDKSYGDESVNSLNRGFQSPGQNWSAADNRAEGKNRRKAELAMLPPNVVSGIPMVRLGSSETQANKALKAMGNMQRQSINGWTIWSYHQPSTGEVALQLYMRHGLVEALRIFDSSLVSPDLGIRLGADLSDVKQRFGEPAFILSEPAPGSGQNYVYPISQVGFLLSRSGPDSVPQVASLLIFNVK